MKRFILATALATSFPAMAQDLATVNGTSITQAELNHTLKTLRLAEPSAEQNKQVLDELVRRHVLVQEAEKLGLDKTDDVQQTLNGMRQELLISALLTNWVEKNPVSDADVQKAYEDFAKKQAERKEYKVRHILVKEEEQAKKLLADIKAKKVSFEEAAKKDSIDPGSGANGGDLGWSVTSAYVTEFAQAVEAAKKGVVTEPVQSQFGYHLILVDDTRPVTPKKLEEVAESLRRQLTQDGIVNYAEELVSKSKIEFKN